MRKYCWTSTGGYKVLRHYWRALTRKEAPATSDEDTTCILDFLRYQGFPKNVSETIEVQHELDEDAELHEYPEIVIKQLPDHKVLIFANFYDIHNEVSNANVSQIRKALYKKWSDLREMYHFDDRKDIMISSWHLPF